MTKKEQRLSSGLLIRQDFRESTRFVFFETDVDDWKYATHGGTAFIVNVAGNLFGLTCRHVMGDFNWRQLVLTDEKIGRGVAGLSSVYYPSDPIDDAVDSDIGDIAVVRFSSDVDAEFFHDSAYVFDNGTVGSSKTGDSLLVYGVLKDLSSITDTEIIPSFSRLEFQDDGPSGADPLLRNAIAKFEGIEFERLTGISGSPVFNVTANRLCGMVVRGGLSEGNANIRYIDVFDIGELLKAIISETFSTRYTKTISQPTPSR